MLTELESSLRLRCWLFLTGVILPVLGITSTYFGLKGSLGPLYQGGSWAYAAILLSWPCLVVMSGLIGFCVVCMTSVVCRPQLKRHSPLRFGIYTGVGLSLVYLVIATVAAGLVPWVAAAFDGVTLLLCVYIAGEVARYWRRFSISQLILLTTVLCVFAATASYLDWKSGTSRLFGLVAILTLAGTPTLTFTAYSIAAACVWRTSDKPTSSLPIRLATWFAIVIAWSQSWKASVDIMVTEYSMLPTNPNCYICSAAANGHPGFVGTEPRPDGVHVNMQMRRCKFLEICLASCFPTAHRLVRKHYDAFGPCVAIAFTRSAWLADVAYITLKPVEWLAELLRIVFGFSSAHICRLYTSEPK